MCVSFEKWTSGPSSRLINRWSIHLAAGRVGLSGRMHLTVQKLPFLETLW